MYMFIVPILSLCLTLSGHCDRTDAHAHSHKQLLKKENRTSRQLIEEIKWVECITRVEQISGAAAQNR